MAAASYTGARVRKDRTASPADSGDSTGARAANILLPSTGNRGLPLDHYPSLLNTFLSYAARGADGAPVRWPRRRAREPDGAHRRRSGRKRPGGARPRGPGVGKTRLVEESVAAVAPARVLWGRCQEMEGAPAFWPWVQVLRAYAVATPPEQLRAELGDDAPLIARLVPSVATRCPGVSPASEETLDPEAARFRLFDAVTMFLRAVVATELLVVVVDDLHWADNESLLHLAFVARELRDQRLLVLGTYRETELRQAAAAARVLGDLARSSHRLTLTGLTGDDVAQYVLAACGRAPAPDTVEAILRATEGNAFFVTEVVQLLIARGQLDASVVRSSSLDLPAGVQEVIRRRIEPLSAEARRVLGAAAVPKKPDSSRTASTAWFMPGRNPASAIVAPGLAKL